MGCNNYVVTTINGEFARVAFKWGLVRELDYQVGDTVSWADRTRPKRADGVVYIGAWHGDDYYSVCVKNDRIEALSPISEPEYERLCNDVWDDLDRS